MKIKQACEATDGPKTARRLVSAPATTRREAVDLANAVYDPVFGEFH